MSKWKNPTYYLNHEGKARMLPQYNLWFDMIQRCTSQRSKKLRPTYKDCTCDHDWLNYDLFLEWAFNQKGFMSKDDMGKIFELDKDLIGPGNMYSPNFCVFIPQEINKFMISVDLAAKSKTAGVSLLGNGTFRSTIFICGKNKHLGCFKTLEQAREAYLAALVGKANKLACKWRGSLDLRVIEPLESLSVKLNLA